MGPWERLERYAKWRTGRLRLDALPNDVIRVVLEHLGYHDARAALFALYETDSVSCIPQELRHVWKTHVAEHALRRTLLDFAEVACYHARDASYASVHADWSHFSNAVPIELARFLWCLPGPRAKILVNDAAVRRFVAQCLQRRKLSTCLSLHMYCAWNGRLLLHPMPLRRTSHCLFPELRSVPSVC